MSEESTIEDAFEQIRQYLKQQDYNSLNFLLDSLSTSEIARALSRLNQDEHLTLFSLLGPERTAELFEDLPDAQVADLLEEMHPERAAAIVEELFSDDRADVLADVEEEFSEAILEQMAPDEAEETRALMEYDEYSAGGLMVTEFLQFSESIRLEEILSDLRKHAEEYTDYNVQYIYITNEEGKLSGVLRMRDMILRPGSLRAKDVAIKDPYTVSADASLDSLLEQFDEHPYMGIPVVDDKQQLLGVLIRSDVEEAAGERADEQFMKASGIPDGEELRSMPFRDRSFRRLSWLMPNIILNLISVTVISRYKDVIDEAVMLAVFMPVISDMSGCSGNQAVAVSIRELSLGLITPKEMMRVFWKEISVGLFNGLVLGFLLGVVASLWGDSSIWLGGIVGFALAVNTVVAVLLGGLVPLLIRRFGKDPALASGPILTTATDMCGFFLVLYIASQMLDKLV